MTEITDDRVTLEEVVPFAWTTVYTFDPYTSRERMEGIVGSSSPALKESPDEGMTKIMPAPRNAQIAAFMTSCRKICRRFSHSSSIR